MTVEGVRLPTEIRPTAGAARAAVVSAAERCATAAAAGGADALLTAAAGGWLGGTAWVRTAVLTVGRAGSRLGFGAGAARVEGTVSRRGTGGCGLAAGADGGAAGSAVVAGCATVSR